MTTTLERPHYVDEDRIPNPLDLAEWKRFLHDESTLETFDTEFPYLAYELGSRAANLSVFTAADNDSGSYKYRGAFTGANEAVNNGARTLVAASGGNFGLSVCHAGEFFDASVQLFLPKSVDEAVVQSAKQRAMNGRVHVDTASKNVDEATRRAKVYSRRNARTAFLHPFDSAATLAGQGTVADDILRIDPTVEQMVMVTGGGGLQGGVKNTLRQLGRGDVHVVTVEVEGSNSFSNSIRNRKVSPADNPNSLFRGACVKNMGKLGLKAEFAYSNSSHVSVSTKEVRDVADLYIQQQIELLRQSLPMYEATSLIAVAGLRHVDLSKRTVIVGSGVNQHPSSLFTKDGSHRQKIFHGHSEQK